MLLVLLFNHLACSHSLSAGVQGRKLFGTIKIDLSVKVECDYLKVGLENGHRRKNLTQNGESRDTAGEHRRRRRRRKIDLGQFLEYRHFA